MCLYQAFVVAHGIFSLCCGGCLVAAGEILVAACGTYFPDQGSNPCPVDWELRVLATGPAGKSPPDVFNVYALWLEDRQGLC